MAKKKREKIDFRFYEIPQGERILALLGDQWRRVYGHDTQGLHFHNLMEIGYCHSGRGILTVDDVDYIYTAGTITILPENVPHTTVTEGDNPDFWEFLYLDPRVVVEELYPKNVIRQNIVMDSINKRGLVLHKKDEPDLDMTIQSMLKEAGKKEAFYRPIIECNLRSFVLQLMRMYRMSEDEQQKQKKLVAGNTIQIAPALDFVEKNFAEDMKIRDLSNLCGMSETHFRRLFEEYTQMSPMDYINLVRIQKACERMKNGNESMDEVARACGFTTTSTFNRNFRKFLDISPYQWKINPNTNDKKTVNYRINALRGW